MSFEDERHEFVTIADRAGALDHQLTVFLRRGRHVLDFWRQRGRWVFKLMVGARVEVERD